MNYNPYQNPYYNPYMMPSIAPVATPQVPTTPQQPTIPQMKLDTVSGRTAVDVYNVDPGQEVILFDIDNPMVYKKQRGLDGKLTQEEYDLIPHVNEVKEDKPKINLDEYMKAEDIQSLIDEKVKEEVDRRLSEISFAPKTNRKSSKGEEQE